MKSKFKTWLVTGILSALAVNASAALVQFGTLQSTKKVKGTLIVTCKNSNNVCVLVKELDDNTSADYIVVQVVDANGAIVAEETCLRSAGVQHTSNADDTSNYTFALLP